MKNDFFYPWRLSGRISNFLLRLLILKPIAFLYCRARRFLPQFTFKQRRRPLPGRKRR